MSDKLTALTAALKARNEASKILQMANAESLAIGSQQSSPVLPNGNTIGSSTSTKVPSVINLSASPWKDQFPSGESLAAKIARLRNTLNGTNVSPSQEPNNRHAAQDSQITDVGVDVESLSSRISPDHVPVTDMDYDKVEAMFDETYKLIHPSNDIITDKYGNEIIYNSKQSSFIDIAGTQGKSAVLIGAAGTGKTTCQKGVIKSLISTGQVGKLSADGHKHLQSDTPGIVVCAYTRRAVANIRRNVPEEMQNNCITIHKLLEYQPVYYEVQDNISGETKTKMQFEATRHSSHPLPASIHTIIVEEGSMLGTDLYKELQNACPHNPQFIFLGDIQQLPPVFGPAILGFKLLELPVVELTEVYRQALESPIISLAHRILSGNPIPSEEFPKWKFPGQLTIHPWKKKIDATNALQTAGMFFTAAADNNVYDPAEDMILIPFNKQFGTDELNKIIANHLAHKRGDYVYEIVAGFNKIYLSPGDKVLYDKEDATILSIESNPAYSGVDPAMESRTMDYWGHDSDYTSKSTDDDTDVDFLLSQVASAASGEDRVNQASHIIVLRMNDSDATVRINSAGDINALLLGYALTVHKSQGSEWRKVFFVCHQSHATMLQRELLYTAVTRAREELYVICEPETFVKGIQSQRVKGDTLEEKAEVFKGKLTDGFRL